jgi:hypothetical protein
MKAKHSILFIGLLALTFSGTVLGSGSYKRFEPKSKTIKK